MSSASTPATWNDAFQAGLTALEREEYQSAIKSLGQALIDAPEQELSGCYSMRGYAFLCTQQYDRALNDCDRAIEHNPLDAEAFAWRGSANAGLKRWRTTVEDFIKAIKLSPENSLEYEQVAINYTEQGLAEMRQQVRDGKSSPQIFQDRGIIYKFRGDYEKAIRDFGQSLDLDKQLATSHV
ncbi:MAG: tetratricopeptide repeat protein, partial [Planctomycetes bacterium]|nr:tetratricopeptide repeat protein [Planctomycetota bacterium]